MLVVPVQGIAMLSLNRTPRSRPSRTLVGLEIEPGAVHAAEVRVNGGLTIETAASIALAPGIVREGEIVDVDALADALRTLFKEHDLGKSVRIGVANQRAVVRHLLLPPIPDAKELATAVQFQAESELPMPLDQAVLEHVALDIIETPAGPRQRVLLVAARRDMIERILIAVRQAGLKPEGIDLSAFGMIRARPGRGEALVVHLAVGGMVNFALTRGTECLFTRVLANGAETMAVDLAERCEITVDEARQALLDIGAGPLAPAPPVVTLDSELEPADELQATTVAPVVPGPASVHATCRTILADGIRRIATDVRNSIDFHLAGAPSDLAGAEGPLTVETVLLAGTAVSIPGFATALGSELGLPVQVMDVAGADPSAPGSHVVAAGLAIEEAVA
jgi:type IV pilus assembly protein PilM